MAPEEGAEPQASPERQRRGTPCGLTLIAAGPLKRRHGEREWSRATEGRDKPSWPPGPALRERGHGLLEHPAAILRKALAAPNRRKREAPARCPSYVVARRDRHGDRIGAAGRAVMPGGVVQSEIQYVILADTSSSAVWRIRQCSARHPTIGARATSTDRDRLRRGHFAAPIDVPTHHKTESIGCEGFKTLVGQHRSPQE